jgi:hypothetical protein
MIRRFHHDPAEVCRLAQNLARTRGWAVFPMRLFVDNGKARKLPARPKREGGSGCHDETTDPEQIAWLWANWPGDLVGVGTGPPSGIVLLDIDKRHDTALAWYHTNKARLPQTLTYRTYSGGLHKVFADPGIGCADGRPVTGIDVKGKGGAMVAWFCFGLPCVDPSPIAPWPAWLTPVIWPPKPPPSPLREAKFSAHPEQSIERALGRIAGAPNGIRNRKLYDGAFHLGTHVAAGRISRSEAERRLEAAAHAAGMTEKEDGITLTIKSGLDGGAAL